MNVCAVRYILENGRNFTHGKTSDYCATIPHEPKSDDRFAVMHVASSDGRLTRTGPFVGDYAECKHCGCLYAEESK